VGDATIEGAIAAAVGAAVARAIAPLLREVASLPAVVTATGGRWCSRAEAAEVLGVSRDTIDRRIADGTLMSRRLGRIVRVLLEAPAGDDEIAALAREARS